MNEISHSAFIHPTARLGRDVTVLANAWIGPNVTLGDRSVVENNAIVGYHGTPETASVLVGEGALIANNVTIYHSVILHAEVKLRHNVVVRENVEIGAGSSIGSGSDIEPNTHIGAHCSFHCGVHITDFSEIADYVFIGPGFVSMSDTHLDYRRPQLHQPYRGVTIRRAARVGGGVVALPGCEVGEEVVVGAGSRVSGRLLPRMVYLGQPARAVRRVPTIEELQKLT